VNGISADAVERLCHYGWPGNVRELENVMERALVLADREELCPEDLPALDPVATGVQPESGPRLSANGTDLNRIVEGVEERLIRQALDQADGVKAEAARLLGLKPSALYYKLEKYGIEA
jgi:two-component system, NtrC family, response regulator HydG